MKIKYHIPTESFGFVEFEEEVPTSDFKDASVGMYAYNQLKALVEPKIASTSDVSASNGGLDDKEWRLALDGYLEVNTLPSEVYERMSKEQQHVIQEIKKSVKRQNYDK